MFLISLFTTFAIVFSQASGPIGQPLPSILPVVPALQEVLMTSFNLPCINSYTVGYVPVTIAGSVNSSACRRISMFKFPVIASGVAKTMSIGVVPNRTVSEICDIGFTLYSFTDNKQIGYPFTGVFNNAAQPGPEGAITVDVSNSRWNLLNTLEYYFTIQTFTYDSTGTYCQMSLPWGQPLATGGGTIGNVGSPQFAIVAQQGPLNMPCGATPWTVHAAVDGGYIHMRITGIAASSSPTPTPTPSPTFKPYVFMPTPSLTPTSTLFPVRPSDSGSTSSSATPSASVTAGLPPSASGSPSVTPSASPSTSQTPVVTPSDSGSPSLTSIPSQTLAPSNATATTQSFVTPSYSKREQTNGPVTSVSQAPISSAQESSNTSGYIGAGVAGLIIGLIAAAVAYNRYKPRYRARDTPLKSRTVIVVNPASLSSPSSPPFTDKYNIRHSQSLPNLNSHV
jgi:hypothetical protein